MLILCSPRGSAPSYFNPQVQTTLGPKMTRLRLHFPAAIVLCLLATDLLTIGKGLAEETSSQWQAGAAKIDITPERAGVDGRLCEPQQTGRWHAHPFVGQGVGLARQVRPKRVGDHARLGRYRPAPCPGNLPVPGKEAWLAPRTGADLLFSYPYRAGRRRQLAARCITCSSGAKQQASIDHTCWC